MKRPLDPPGWAPDLVPPVTAEAKRLARNKRARQRNAEKARIRDAAKPKKPFRVPRAPREPKPRKRPAPRRVMAMRSWRRLLVLLLIQAGQNKTREISALLSTDPTSVAQSICELKRMGILPSQIGRTPIASRVQPKR